MKSAGQATGFSVDTKIYNREREKKRVKTLYHGTISYNAYIICNNGIDVKAGMVNSDFGQGFYTTDSYEKAVAWAKRKAIASGTKPAIVSVTFDDVAARCVIEYFSDDLRWGRFIINNRNGTQYIAKVPFKDNNLDARYHITCGRIADYDVIDVAKELRRKGRMLASIDRLYNPDYPLQYAFHTDDSLSFIKKLSYRNL